MSSYAMMHRLVRHALSVGRIERQLVEATKSSPSTEIQH